MDDFTSHQRMREEGADAATVYRCAVHDGLDPIARVRMVCAVFGLDLRQAKTVIDAAENGSAHDAIAALDETLDRDDE